MTEISSEIADILENLDEDDKNSTDAVSEDGDSFVATELKKAVKSIGKDPQTDFDRALVNAQRLFDEEREVRKNVKNLRSALDEKTRTVIEGLSGEQAADLLAAKWVEPLHRKLEELPQTAVDELIASVNALNDKYSTTYSDVCEQIEQAEAELGNMLDQLTATEFRHGWYCGAEDPVGRQMMTEQAKVPAIRFAGFTDPWEQRKLENLASFGGGHTPSMADASNYVDGKILWVTSQDVA